MARQATRYPATVGTPRFSIRRGIPVDFPRKSGGFPMRQGGSDGTAEALHEGVQGWGGLTDDGARLCADTFATGAAEPPGSPALIKWGRVSRRRDGWQGSWRATRHGNNVGMRDYPNIKHILRHILWKLALRWKSQALFCLDQPVVPIRPQPRARSRLSCASTDRIAVGYASRRFNPIGKPVPSQIP